MVNHRGPLPLRELHSTGETIVWRDPGGSWACLPPVYDCVWIHPATGCNMWTTPEKYTKRRETPGNANQNKISRRAGYKKVYKKTKNKNKNKGRIMEPYEILNKTSTLTTIARLKKAKEKALKMNQSNWKGALRKPLWEEQSPTKC